MRGQPWILAGAIVIISSMALEILFHNASNVAVYSFFGAILLGTALMLPAAFSKPSRPRNLKEAKDAVSKRYLGQFGIHGVGLKRSKEAVMLYVVDANATALLQELPAINRVARPFAVILQQSSPANLA